MNMPVLPATSSSPPPTEAAARATDAGAPGSTRSFSTVLSRQQGHPVAAKGAATTSRVPAGEPRDGKTKDPLDPDSTLALILDSTALPIMQGLPQAAAVAGTPAAGQPADAVAEPTATAAQGASPIATAAAVTLLSDVAAATQMPPDTAPSPRTQKPAVATPGQAPESLPAMTAALAVPEGTPVDAGHGAGRPAPTAAAQTAAGAQPADASQNPRSSGLLAALTEVPKPNQATTADDTQAPAFAAPIAAAGLAPAAAAMPATTPVITLAVPTPLASPQWAQDLSRQMVTLAQSGINGTHTVQLHVNPPELGPVHITLQIGDSLTQAAFVSPHLHVRQALENALPGLAQQFAQAGLSLGQANVSDQQSGQQGFAQQSQNPQNPSGTSFNLDANTAGIAPLSFRPPNPARHPDALVDTFV